MLDNVEKFKEGYMLKLGLLSPFRCDDPPKPVYDAPIAVSVEECRVDFGDGYVAEQLEEGDWVLMWNHKTTWGGCKVSEACDIKSFKNGGSFYEWDLKSPYLNDCKCSKREILKIAPKYKKAHMEYLNPTVPKLRSSM